MRVDVSGDDGQSWVEAQLEEVTCSCLDKLLCPLCLAVPMNVWIHILGVLILAILMYSFLPLTVVILIVHDQENPKNALRAAGFRKQTHTK